MSNHTIVLTECILELCLDDVTSKRKVMYRVASSDFWQIGLDRQGRIKERWLALFKRRRELGRWFKLLQESRGEAAFDMHGVEQLEDDQDIYVEVTRRVSIEPRLLCADRCDQFRPKADDTIEVLTPSYAFKVLAWEERVFDEYKSAKKQQLKKGDKPGPVFIVNAETIESFVGETSVPVDRDGGQDGTSAAAPDQPGADAKADGEDKGGVEDESG